MLRSLVLILAAAVLFAASSPSAARADVAATPAPEPPICGAPLAPGPLAEPPSVAAASLPVNDRGLHELVLRAAHAGDRYCFRYTWNGEERVDPPTLRVHRGERFAVRVVNELSGPASGANAAASSLPPCLPAPMMVKPSGTYLGYLNHAFRPVEVAPMGAMDVNLHLHGFQGPAQQEDVFLSTLSTPQHACEYDVTVPATQPPGTYFYHPHAHGVADDEVAGGLSGMWIVEPDAPQLPAADDHAVVLRYRIPFKADYHPPKTDSLGVTAALHLSAQHKAAPVAFDPFAPPAWPSTLPVRDATSSMDPNGCGTFGSPLVAVDGVDAPASLVVPAGEPQLLRVLDATSDTAKMLRLRDANDIAVPMKIVGRDGVPLSGDEAHPLARYALSDGLLLPPTGRADLLVTLAPGQRLTLYSDRVCTGAIADIQLPHDLLTITAGPAPVHPTAIASEPLATTAPAATALVRYARHHPHIVRRALTYTQYVVPGPTASADPRGVYYITETSRPGFVEHAFAPSYARGAGTPSQADIVVKRGTVEEWYLYNATLETHSFHIHQMPFAVEGASGGPTMMDTVLVPGGAPMPNAASPDYPLVRPSLTRIVLDFRNVPKGEFVFHCHMLYHEDHGMMGVVRVI